MIIRFFAIFMMTLLVACASPPGPNRLYPNIPYENLNEYFSGSVVESDKDLSETLELGEGACVLAVFAVETSGKIVDPGISAFSGIGLLKQSLFPDVVERLNATQLTPIPGKAKQVSSSMVFTYFEAGTSEVQKEKVKNECAQFI